MNDVKTMPITVTLPQAWIDVESEPADLAQLESTLRDYADGLWQERGMEATSRVTVTVSQPAKGAFSHRAPQSLPAMTINGQQARLAFPGRHEPALQPAAWGRRLARAIYANRALAGPAAASSRRPAPSLTLSLSQPPPAALASALADVQQRIFERLGLFVPRIRAAHNPELDGGAFQIAVNERRLPPAVGDGDAALGLLEEEIVRHAPHLLTTSLVETMLALLARDYGALVDVVEQRRPAKTLCDVLRGLLAEEVSIGDLPTILEGLLAINNTTGMDVSEYIVFTPATGVTAYTSLQDTASLQTETLVAAVRTFLKMQLSRQYAPLGQTMYCILLDPSVEKALQRQGPAAYAASDGPALRLAIREELWYVDRPDVVLLTSIEVRKKLWELIHVELPQLPVLCYQELSPDLSLEPLARVAL